MTRCVLEEPLLFGSRVSVSLKSCLSLPVTLLCVSAATTQRKGTGATREDKNRAKTVSSVLWWGCWSPTSSFLLHIASIVSHVEASFFNLYSLEECLASVGRGAAYVIRCDVFAFWAFSSLPSPTRLKHEVLTLHCERCIFEVCLCLFVHWVNNMDESQLNLCSICSALDFTLTFLVYSQWTRSGSSASPIATSSKHTVQFATR